MFEIFGWFDFMILPEIIMADCTGLILTIVLWISRYFVRRTRSTEDKFFTALVIFGLAGTVFELITFLIDGQPGVFARIVNVSANALVYSCTASISLLWLWYVDSNLNHDAKRITRVFMPFVIVWAILMVMLVVNIFIPFLFVIEKNNVYGRMPLGYIFYVFLFISFITSIVIYIKHRIKHGRSQFFPIWMFLIPVIEACIIQALW